MFQNVMPTLTLVTRIFISVFLLVFGGYFLIAGKLRIGKYSVKGLWVRIIGAVTLLGSAIYFLAEQRGFFQRYGVLVQLILLLVAVVLLWILAKKPARHQPLSTETLHYQSPPDEPAYRLHLRLRKDGSGILIVNAATVLHLNPSAAEYAYHLMKGTSPEEAAKAIAARYRINRAHALRDFLDFRERIKTLINIPDLDPVTYLDFERVAPHSQDLTAPLRLDCALTYRLPKGADPSLAPTKRVDRELETAEWQSVIDQAWTQGIPHIIFTGGEATLRGDLPELVAHAEKNGQVTGLLTDGLKLADMAYLDTLLQTGLDHLLVVLQPDNKVSWRALETVMPADIFTTVHLTINAKTAKNASEYLAKLAELGVKSLSLSPADKKYQDTVDTLRQQAAELGITLTWDLPVPYSTDNPVALETAEDETPSGAGKVWLYIEPDGDVLPAQGMADTILGNILKDPWEKIYGH
jgi:organic radical activating enzyme